MTDIISIITTFITLNFPLLITLFSVAVVHHIVKGITAQIAIIGITLLTVSWVLASNQLLLISIVLICSAFVLKIMGVR